MCTSQGRLLRGPSAGFTCSTPTSMSLTRRFLVQLQLLPKPDDQLTSATPKPDETGATHTSDFLTPLILAVKPHSRPIFGVSLQELFSHDLSAVPIVVCHCIQAVDHFGLDVEGIYRMSGAALHVNALRDAFNNNASAPDFRNPANFHHDINSVATLLKQFFRNLPDPLFTGQAYNAFIDAACIDDEGRRRDAVHRQVNNLPNLNYATLRALVLHLHRVLLSRNHNQMSTSNLAICFA
jgi:hypothetical protein